MRSGERILRNFHGCLRDAFPPIFLGKGPIQSHILKHFHSTLLWSTTIAKNRCLLEREIVVKSCIHLVGTIALVLIRLSFSAFHDNSFTRLADSLFQLSDTTQKTLLKVHKDYYKFYQVTTCKTINQPFMKLIKVLQDVESYHTYFGFMKRSRFLYDSITRDSVALFEPGVLYYRAYYFGKISDTFNSDSTKCILYCGNADQKKYKHLWSKQIGGLIKIGFHEMDIYWTIQKLSNDCTRISLTTSQAPAIWIPQWLMEIAVKGIFPGMLQDLEEYMKCENMKLEVKSE
jgi:ribosome-associated toxin RatA of RatAB toxin-antitoxin module